MLIWSLLSLFGLWIAHRTLRSVEKLQIATSDQMFRVQIIIFLTVVMLNFLFRNAILPLFGVSFVIFLSPIWAPILIEKRRESLLQSQFLPILDQLTLLMKSGKAFRPSLLVCLERNTRPVQYALQEFLSAIQYQKEIKELSREPKIRFFFQELSQVDKSSHKPIDRLKALRRRLMIEKNFRQKSRQALLQVRFQAWIISFMYVLILVYVQHDFGIQNHFGLFLASALLFLTGLIWILKMGRSYRWKI